MGKLKKYGFFAKEKGTNNYAEFRSAYAKSKKGIRKHAKILNLKIEDKIIKL